MSNDWNPDHLANEFDRITKPDANGLVWYDCFADAATALNLPIAILIAIASRETHIQNIVGDGGHGYGIMQIDIRYHHDFVTQGLWKSVPANIKQGAQILSDMRAQVEHWSGKSYKGTVIPTMDSEEVMKVAVAGYNAGFNAIVQYALHGDPDLATTGHDYSEDVLQRAEVFEDLIDAHANAGANSETNPST